MSTVIPVILSGGSGSRLWPKSRQHYPKQLHRLYGQHTMLQHTLQRCQSLAGQPIVICNNEQRFMVAEQVQQLGIKANIILEPVARNTAPAIVIAALKSIEQDENAVIAVFPADHLIKNQTAFDEALQIAVNKAKGQSLATFGIVPSHPETGYGYIKADKSGEDVLAISEFVEKPNLETAQKYLDSGDYFWNSGMFVFSVSTLLEEFERLDPNTLAFCKAALAEAEFDLDFCRLNEQAFSQAKSESIDYALMEKTNKAYMVPMDAGWSDVGSWQALWEVAEKDQNGNAFDGDVMSVDSQNCYVNADGRLVALVGVDDLIVVETADSILVAKKDASQKVKRIVETLQAQERSEFEAHREVYRPWGSYDLVESGNRYQVKRITVKPGASLSLQMHHHRAEHWVVVAGTAEVQKGESKTVLSENQSIYIPLGETHRLSNPGKIPLHLIEVASGSYLGEDDIIRFKDDFGRQ